MATGVTFADVTTGLMLSQGDTTTITINSTVSFDPPSIIIGDILFLKSTNTLDLLPPEYYEVRAKVDAVTVSGVNVVADVTLVSISSLTPTIASDFRVAVSEEGYDLFSRKFPRFAYRYKYEDGEYSSIGPYSDVVFLPGDFRYHPTEAYNKGMVNNLKSLTLKDFVPTNIPEDVVQVDLLFRDETSSKIYAVKNIAATDDLWMSEGSFPGSFGSYEVSTENIYASLPTNQSLRPWDNVPRLSLGQEVAGSRLIYANYLQGYELEVSPSITASVEIRNLADGGFVGQRSVKSLRTYDIGIVYGDKYGRETPVFTNKEASIILPKVNADLASSIKVEVDTQHPSWAKYYKFFVKETSNEYYNLALGRTYDAEDGNIWLAFPSVDRNKVDEDTYLILKKGVDKNEVVTEKARYKIVAIENEAPDYIKTTYTTIAKPVSWPGVLTHAVFGGAGVGNTDKAPTPGAVSFYIDYNRWVGDTSNANEFGMPDLLEQYQEVGSEEMFVNFVRTIDGVAVKSKYYSVTNVVVHDATEAVGTAQKVYEVFVSKPFAADEKWIGEIVVDAKARPVFYRLVIENKPEFDGRFFVKIENDPTATASLTPVVVEDTDWRVTATAPLYYLRDSGAQNIETSAAAGFNAVSSVGVSDATTGLNATMTKSHWEDALKFGGTEVVGRWFIDQVSYCGWHRDGLGYTDAVTDNDMVDFDSMQTYINEDGDSDTGLYGTGASRGLHFQEGIASWSDASVVEGTGSSGPNNVGIDRVMTLSYSAIDPDTDFLAAWGNIVVPSPANLTANWKVGDDENSHEVQEKYFVEQIKAGSKFRMAATPDQTYTIWKVETEYLYNHRANLPQPYHRSYDDHSSNGDWSKSDWILENTNAINKRTAWHIHYTIDSDIIADDLKTNTAVNSADAFNTSNLQFIEEYDQDRVEPISQFPAIFETEPKEDVDLDIYYEASGKIPTSLKDGDGSQLVPIGSTMNIPPSVIANFKSGITVTGWGGPDMNGNYKDNIVLISPRISFAEYLLLAPLNSLTDIIFSFKTPFGGASYVKFVGVIYEIGTGSSAALEVTGFEVEAISKVGLSWFNCWSFGNGVESNRIGDTYNKPYLTNGATASTTLDKKYGEEKRSYGLIYSGLYNSVSGVNDLNQFIAAEKITKDINPMHGSIQKLYARDSDLLTLCEDKCLKILVQKDALFNADGNSQLLAREGVLGQAVPFSGEYGISKNPESFASESYRAYFTDKVRGSVMRLSMDGLTSISDHGMKDYFRDNLKLSNKLIGSYDDRKNEYNITIEDVQKTVSFREDVRGWVSFKSFVAENAISCANEYYTFVKGKPWRHHVESVNRNTFYEQGFTNSSLTVLMNDMPGSVKSFSTVNYEGSQARVSLSLDANGTIVQDGDYFNLTPLEGWFVDSAFTNLEKGSVSNFIEKEGKWFGFINGDNITSNFFGITTENFDTSDFSIQGIGMLNSTPTVSSASGCTDATAFNYQSAATVDDGSCYAIIHGCMDTDADNFTPLVSDILVDVNTSDSSCLYYGCDVVGSFNFDPTANSNDGSCVAVVYGCTNPTQFGFNPLANTDNGSCTPFVYGCMDDTTPGGCGPGCDGALNYHQLANTGGPCTYAVPGCMNFDAWNYSSSATYQPIAAGTCKMCGDITADNYDYASVNPIPDDYSGCIYCPATTGFTATASATVATEIDLQWDLPLSNLNVVNNSDYTVSVTNVVDSTTVSTSITPVSSGPYLTHTITGLSAGTDYSITIQAVCSNTDGPTSSTKYATTIHIIGCMDGDGTYNGNGSWPACNFNPNATSQTGGVVGYSASDCNYNCAGCTDPNYAEFCNTCYTSPVGDFGTVSVNGPWIYDDGSCVTLILGGCTDDSMMAAPNGAYNLYSNYNPLATFDDGSCILTVLGCTDDSTINANNSTVIAATNYNSLANTDDGSCIYPCPTLTQSGTNFSNAYPPASFSSNRITSHTNLSLTNYSANMLAGGLGLPNAYTATFKVTDNNGAVLYNNANQGGFTIQYHAAAAGGGFSRHKLQLDFSALNVTEGNHNSITCDMEITTNDGNCVVSKVKQYTIGCTDSAASNYGTKDFTDNTQCEYVGCTDSTLSNDGITYFATNYNDQATVACTDINGGYSAASSPSQDNACCTYPNLPTSEFIISHAFNMYASAYSDYSSLNVMENTVTDTAYTTAEITQFNVTAPAAFGWQSNWIGGYSTNALYTEAKWLDIPLSGSVDLTTIANYSATGIVNHSTIPSNFDNRDLIYSPAHSGNLYNALAVNGLTIDYKVKFTATIINQSRANQIEYIVHNTQAFSGGCKTSTTGVYTTANSNLDSTWDMHIPGSCVLNLIPGCTTATAINYNSAATVDDGSCCLTCQSPTPLTIPAFTLSAISTAAVSATISFTEVCQATSYSLYVQGLFVNNDAVTVLDNNILPGALTFIPSTGLSELVVPLTSGNGVDYPINSELTFTLYANCISFDGTATTSTAASVSVTIQ